MNPTGTHLFCTIKEDQCIYCGKSFDDGDHFKDYDTDRAKLKMLLSAYNIRFMDPDEDNVYDADMWAEHLNDVMESISLIIEEEEINAEN